MMAGHIHTTHSRSIFRRRMVFFLACLLPVMARAVDRFDVFVGYNEFVPESSWFPVVCEVENQGPIFSGFIEVSSGAFGEGAKRVVPIELPSGTTKRITIPVFYERTFAGGWHVRLVDGSGREKVLRQVPARRNIKVDSVLLGSMSRDNVWTPPLQKLKIDRREYEPAAARLLPGLVPDNPITLGGLDALYLNSERVTDLRQGQRDAIEQWIMMGGHLIVGVEAVSDVNSSPWLRRLVPGRLAGVQTVEAHPGLQEWIRSPVAYGGDQQDAVDMTPGPVGEPTLTHPFADRQDDLEFEVAEIQVAVTEPVEGRVLVSAGSLPLILQRAHGLGRVTLLTFSPEREPFRSWKNLPAMWSRLTEVPPEWYASEDYRSYGGWGMDGIFGAMIDSRQIRKLPVGWLLLLLVAYLAVIGPFDRWWLRKIGKPMLTWITFPLYVVLFSSLIYMIGYKLRAGEREWNELHVVDVVQRERGTEFRGRTYGSLYSPVNDTYRLAGPQKLAAFRGEAASSWGSGGGVERLEILQREQSFDSETYVPVWTSQLYVNEWWADGSSPMRVRLTPRPNGVTCHVENISEHNLVQLRLVIDGRVYTLGDLAAGESKDDTLLVSNGQPLAEALSSLGADSLYSTVSQRGQAFGGATSGRIDNLAGGCFMASFLSAAVPRNRHESFEQQPGTDLSRALRDHAVLVALAEGQAAAPSMRQFRASRGSVNTFWRMAIPLTSQL